MQREFKRDDLVKHFKKEANDFAPNAYLYRILYTDARETQNYKKVVVYIALYDSPDGLVKTGDVFVRDYDEFMSEVDHEKYTDIKQKYRFELFEQ